MIGYYVHHQGSGHRNRALCINHAFAGQLTGLSTLPRPDGWIGDWVVLPDDAVPDDARSGTSADVDGHGRLHYVPLGGDGLSVRTAALSRWLDATRPAAVVVDVSVEVALLVRLHGVPVVTMAQPGRRRDPAHRLGYDLAAAIVAPWPADVGNLWDGTAADLAKTSFVGAVSRFSAGDPDSLVADRVGPGQPRLVVVLNGTGGSAIQPDDVAAAQHATPDWEWVHLDRTQGRWLADPSMLLAGAAVVVAHAGQNAIAELAALRRPAVIIPQQRPFDEQVVTAAALNRAGMPVEVLPGWPEADRWPGLLAEVSELDGAAWRDWNDGGGAVRAAAVLAQFDRVPQSVSVPA